MVAFTLPAKMQFLADPILADSYLIYSDILGMNQNHTRPDMAWYSEKWPIKMKSYFCKVD